MTSNIPFTNKQLSLSRDNYDAQEKLFEFLETILDSRTSDEVDTVCVELDLSLEELRHWVSGNVDLTLSQLRYLANALGVEITYSVNTNT